MLSFPLFGMRDAGRGIAAQAKGSAAPPGGGTSKALIVMEISV
jgi:hypothetical protein